MNTLNSLSELEQPCIVCKNSQRDKPDSKQCSIKCSRANKCKWCQSNLDLLNQVSNDKYCNFDCKEKMKNYSSIPLCYRENCLFQMQHSYCIFKDRCWAKHPKESSLNFNIIIQVDKNQKNRMMDQIINFHNSQLVECMPQQPLTVNNKYEQVLLCILYHKDINILISDQIMGDAIQRIYKVNYRYINTDQIISQIKNDLISIQNKFNIIPIRLQLSPKSLQDKLCPIMFKENIILDNNNYQIVFSIIENEQGYMQGYQIPNDLSRKFIGWANGGRKIDQNKQSSQELKINFNESSINKDNSNQQNQKFLSNKDIICRAKFKITELLTRSSLFKKQIESDSEKQCIDIGSSPGGWTYALCENVVNLKKIQSIDPGHLDPRILGNPKVNHMNLRAEKIVEQVNNKNLNQDQETIISILNKNNKSVDISLLIQNMANCRRDASKLNLLVNDMNISPELSISITQNQIDCFHGIEMLVVTLKSHSLKDIDISEKKYAEQFRVKQQTVEVQHLFNNTLFERTMVIKITK